MTVKRIIVSQKVKSFRRENRLTQEQFASALGLSPQTISKWEREECYPDITFLPTLADTLGCTVNDFFAWDGIKKETDDQWSPLRVDLRFYCRGDSRIARFCSRYSIVFGASEPRKSKNYCKVKNQLLRATVGRLFCFIGEFIGFFFPLFRKVSYLIIF